MSKSRTAQLIFQSFSCAFGLIGVVGSVGLFNYALYWDFYTYFTNISTFLCVGVMAAELVQTARKREDSYVTVAPRLRFISMLGALLTCLVFNLLLAGEEGRDPALNYQVESIMCHVLLPVLYTADWFLFYERGRTRWSWPLLSALFPLAYCALVWVHALILRFDSSIMNYNGTDPLIYPYFFLNPDRQGAAGIARWIGILLLAFIVLGYLLYAADHLLRRKAGRR